MSKTNQKKLATGVVRVLVGFDEAAHKLKPNQLVMFDADRAAELEKEGRVSAHPAGIAWCRKEYPEAQVLDLSAAAQPEGEQGGPDAPPAE